ncbi:hypothetical protein GCM10008931_08090 [Oceanobacillus oncorhynchi subsp. oncorhynchi]|uniref:hypothetical protein n=1 Tax=Oceanobacillus oncorhynchi TaxID=545501 RepID=UPI0031DAF86A
MKQIETVNHVPNLISFYEKVKHEKEEAIGKRWEEEYGFTALPPGEKGRNIARQMLKEVCEQFEDCIEIKQLDPGKIQMNKH